MPFKIHKMNIVRYNQELVQGKEMKTDKAVVDEALTSEKILDVARDQVRRFGEAKTNVVDIARALGTSHTTIYRHFRSKADVFDALVGEAMRDEEELARTFVDSEGAASERLEGFVLALHRRKLQRFANDPEVYQLYRRVVDERPGLIHDYAARMTRLVAKILADGVRKKEYKIDDIDAAAEVVRDAVTVYVHPAHVEAAAKVGLPLEPAIKRMISTLNVAFRSGLFIAPVLAQPEMEKRRSPSRFKTVHVVGIERTTSSMKWKRSKRFRHRA